MWFAREVGISPCHPPYVRERQLRPPLRGGVGPTREEGNVIEESN